MKSLRAEATQRLHGYLLRGMTNAEAVALVNRELAPLAVEQAREGVEIAREALAVAEAELAEAEAHLAAQGGAA